jgi:hypothetical protein
MHRLILFGGLGNQMFQYITARELFGENFIIDISFMQNSQYTFELPDLAQLTLVDSIKYEAKKKSYFEKKAFLLILKLTSIQERISIKYKILVQARKICYFIFSQTVFTGYHLIPGNGIGWSSLSAPVGRNCVLIGNFHSYRWINQNLNQYRNELQLKQNDKTFDFINQNIGSSKRLIVHVRLGDYLGISELNVVDRNYFNSAIIDALNAYNYHEIWIFTNDLKKVNDYLDENNQVKYRFFDSDQFTSAETLEIMKIGDGYVLSNSTYSWWGAFLSYKEPVFVLTPSKWYRSTPEPSYFIPKSWQRFEVE